MAAKRPRQGVQRTKVSFVIVVFSTCAIVPLFVICFSSAAKVRRTASSAFRTSSAFLAGDTSATHCSSYALIDASALSSFGPPVRCVVTVATCLRAGEHVRCGTVTACRPFCPHGQPPWFITAPSGALLFWYFRVCGLLLDHWLRRRSSASSARSWINLISWRSSP